MDGVDAGPMLEGLLHREDRGMLEALEDHSQRAEGVVDGGFLR
jgi:hypothetical protein